MEAGNNADQAADDIVWAGDYRGEKYIRRDNHERNVDKRLAKTK